MPVIVGVDTQAHTPSVLPVLCHSSITVAVWGRSYYHPHFTDEEVKVLHGSKWRSWHRYQKCAEEIIQVESEEKKNMTSSATCIHV